MKLVPSPGAREALGAGVLLFVLLAIFFSGALLPGHVLSPSEALLATPFFSDVAPPGLERAPSPLLFDQVYQFAPWRYFAWQSLRQGQIPLWNPYSMSGTPFIASMQSAVFYPINLTLNLVSFDQTFVWSAILRLWVAGFFTYLLLRRYGLGLASSMTGAISFMLCGFLIVWLGHPHVNVAVWLPALILLGELILQSRRTSELLRWIGALALIVGLQFLGGHIESSVDILLALALYYLLRWLQVIWPLQIKKVAKFARLIIPPTLAVSLGAALAAIQLVPFFEWLGLSAELHSRAARVFQIYPSNFWQNLFSLPLLAFPNLYSNPSWGSRVAPFLPFGTYWWLPWGNYNEAVLYVGVISLILALLAILRKWSAEPLVKLWTLAAALTLALALHLPVFDWFNQLPGLILMPADRLRLITSFSLCVLAGFGAETFLNNKARDHIVVRRLWNRLNIVVILTGALILLGGYIGLPLIRNRIIDYGRRSAEAEFAKRETHSHPLDYYYSQVDQIYEQLSETYRLTNAGIYLPGVFAAASLLAVVFIRPQARVNSRALAVVLPLLVSADLIAFGHDYNPVVAVSNFYPSTLGSSFLTQDSSLFRSTSLQTDFLPDVQMLYGWSDIRGMDFPTFWYDQYTKSSSGRFPSLPYAVLFDSVESPLVRVLNLKYIMTSADSANTPRDSESVERSGTMRIWKINAPQPRSFMVYESVVAASDDQAVQVLNEAPQMVFRRVVLAQANAAPSPAPLKDADSMSSVSLIRYAANETAWRVVTSVRGYLVNSDSFYPGWKAFVDGQPAVLYRANLAFRAVEVSAGEHTVEFRFEPDSFKLGALVSLGALLCVGGLLITPSVRI